MSKVKLSIEVEPELRRRVKVAAASNDQSLRDWITQAVERQLEQAESDVAAFSRLSLPAFRRDWDSEDDTVYDQVS